MSDYNETHLYPEERFLLEDKTNKKRQIEFCLGQLAIHEAMRRLNVENSPILRGEFNEPLWPRGLTGSLSHSEDIALAVVTPIQMAAGVGVDIQKLTSKKSLNFIKKICLSTEIYWMTKSEKEKFLRFFLVFSAKESVFKAFFPTVRSFFSLKEIELIWNDIDKKFAGRLRRTIGSFPKEYQFEVGCSFTKDYVFTYSVLPP